MEGASRHGLAAARATLDEATATAPGAPRPVDAGRIAEDLRAVAELLAREPAVRRALTDPGAPVAARTELVTRLFGTQLAPASLRIVHTAVGARWSRPFDLQYALLELSVEALLVEAERDGALEEVEDELFRFGRILDQNAPLALALTDPAAPAAVKDRLLTRLLAGRAHPVTVRLVQQAAADRIHGDVERRLAEFSRIAAARRGRVVAIVRTAVPLSSEVVARLGAAISRYFGRQIQLQVDLDPDILGGVVVQVGGEVVDGSVLRRFVAARRALLR
ncbi:ATP synthase F1 subcomplex delta subunit [Frankia casuarinae]|uniref:ATP synthase subunit delta n=1 Tax=Frankia casuarinae (strain DSM 45818 / CECT 9043 / HFP020203 / CcI3) TaxID=106370 RepID=ATPD_FRACC|nr:MULTISPECIES: F0F1 ATP synthase subunit delta [Frankia]Q2J6N0.1 RecName: Full=ATP synthase subunit delta; AltName: Full=ATP synthase F(1) sector subunit delta; AltName: Full=F-type ATPase subunit delta; Short=F-ATPase subunit delta [Frankia casuarinae]ABD13062.1 ATP synthase F1 subcomplex delta subunit [Frankia casuarinae]ETA01758.1 ATP synthase F1 subcomplex delta subunit [Frankia sp. CcI6]EYT92428.1 ATP synthase F1 subcomplex delta subunit [Frankia casuarinae]KDA42256.1 ATP synthase F1 su